MYNEKYFYYLCIILIVGRVKAICKYFRSKVKSFPITIKNFLPKLLRSSKRICLDALARET